MICHPHLQRRGGCLVKGLRKQGHHLSHRGAVGGPRHHRQTHAQLACLLTRQLQPAVLCGDECDMCVLTGGKFETAGRRCAGAGMQNRGIR